MDSQSRPVVECRGLWYFPSKRSSNPILSELNMTVPYNKTYGLIGPSGCGKTTLQRCIWGYYKPSFGTIRTLGKIPGDKDSFVPGKDIGYMPQDISLDSALTIREVLTFFGTCFGLDKLLLKQKIDELLPLIGEKDSDRRIDRLSMGQQRRVSFACAIIHEPKLLILDEPTVGSDPLLRKAIWDHMELLKNKRNTTIIISTHYTDELKSADLVAVMKDGKIVCQENPQNLIEQFNATNLEDCMLKLWTNLKPSSNLQPSSTIEMIHREIPDSGLRNKLIHDSEKPKVFPLFRRALKNFYKVTLFSYLFILITNLFCIKSVAIFFGGIPSDLKIGYLVDNNETFSNPFIEALPMDIITPVLFDSYEEARMNVEKKLVKGLLVFHQDFISEFEHSITCNYKSTRDCLSSERNLITFIGDPTNRFIFDTLNYVFEKTFEDITSNYSLRLNRNLDLFKFVDTESVFKLNEPDYFWEGKHSTIWRLYWHFNFTIPILLPISYIIKEIKSGIIERFLALGYSKFQILAPTFILLTIISIFFNVITFLTAISIHTYAINSAIWTPLSFAMSLAICGSLLGFVITLLTKDEAASIVIYIFHNITGLFVTGSIWPREALPYFTQIFPYLYPSTFASDAVVETMTKGLSISQSKASLFGQQVTVIHCLVYFLLIVLLVKN